MKREVLAIVLAAVASVACSDEGANITGPSSADVPPSLAAVLGDAFIEELESQRIYERVVVDHGQVLPFVNIIRAEQQHAGSVRTLLIDRGLPLPPVLPTVDGARSFATLTAACGASAQEERALVARYDGWLQLDLPADVKVVFENNRRASLTAHLPAFERCQ